MKIQHFVGAMEALYPGAEVPFDVALRTKADGSHEIAVWNEPKLGPKPADLTAIAAKCDELALNAAQDPAPVKAEAMRRILAIAPEWRQRNMIARSVELLHVGQENWTSEEQAEVTAMQAIWDQISAIRAASDTIEMMDPRPPDITADALWP